MKPPFKFSWELVTPDLAEAWLKKNTKNRNLRETTVQAFASDMARGAWSPSPQGIAFGANGNLIDGQHRLAAIVRSGVAIEFLICRDVPKRIAGVKADVMDALDRGNARSVADVLKLSHGYKANALIITTSCWNIAALCVANPLTRVRKLSVSTAIAIAERYRDGLSFVSENRPKTIGLRAAPICAAVAFAYAIAPKKCEAFYRSFATGVGLSEDSPILTLRNAFLDDMAVTRHTKNRDRIDGAELVLHALSCVINRQEMARIPKPGQRAGANWFREQQPENVAFLEGLFPTFEQKENVITARTFKLTKEAASLLAGKEMSERINRKLSRNAA